MMEELDKEKKRFNSHVSIDKSIEEANDSRRKRYSERDRSRSIENKRNKKESKYWAKEDEILLTHTPYNGDSTKSPHILINKWFHWLKKNDIALKSPRENKEKRNRKIFYEIDFIGENIKYSTTRKYLNFHLENTEQKWILILVKFEEIMYNPKLGFSLNAVF